MLTPCEAIALERKALNCLREGEANPETAEAARMFSMRAVSRLLEENYMAEAMRILSAQGIDKARE